MKAAEIVINVASPEELVKAVSRDVRTRRTTVYAPIYAAVVLAAHRDATYGRLLSLSCNYPDGAGVVWALRRRGVRASRTALTDVIHDILREASRGTWRIVLYGGTVTVVAVVCKRIERDYPGVVIAAAFDGYSEVAPATVAGLRPDLTLVARGPVLQETWAHAAAQQLAAAGSGPVMTCGGLFDFLAGTRRRAPVWMQQVGLEWAYRLMLEPRRLLRRYLVGNTWFILHFLLGRRSIPYAPLPPGEASGAEQ